jgi:hypothetical protein
LQWWVRCTRDQPVSLVKEELARESARQARWNLRISKRQQFIGTRNQFFVRDEVCSAAQIADFQCGHAEPPGARQLFGGLKLFPAGLWVIGG